MDEPQDHGAHVADEAFEAFWLGRARLGVPVPRGRPLPATLGDAGGLAVLPAPPPPAAGRGSGVQPRQPPTRGRGWLVAAEETAAAGRAWVALVGDLVALAFKLLVLGAVAWGL